MPYKVCRTKIISAYTLARSQFVYVCNHYAFTYVTPFLFIMFYKCSVDFYCSTVA